MASQLPPGTDLCAIPAGAPPDGQLPNLVDPETLETSLVVVSSVMTAWAALFTAARIYTNKRKLQAADCEYFWSVAVSCQMLTSVFPDFVAVGFVLSTTYTGLVLASECNSCNILGIDWRRYLTKL